MYAEREVRSAGCVLAGLEDLDDVVDVQLPAPRNAPEGAPDPWQRLDWRSRLVSWMFDRARDQRYELGRHCDEWGSWRKIGANGLPGELTWEVFVASSSARRNRQNIAGTRPLQLLTWSGENWRLPRAYVDLLDRYERREGELVACARLCSSCGDQGPLWGDWRTPTTSGYVTRCPPCSGAAFRPYTGHLHGVPYEKFRLRGTRADGYLCRLCRASQAFAWDHCHEHGHVRGPLCTSCNNVEGKAAPDSFL
jgi:hypothetical protein